MKLFLGGSFFAMQRSMRFASNALILCVIASILSGCIANTTNPTNAQNVVTLKFAWWSNGEVKDGTFTSWVQSFERTHPNIKIEPVFLDWNTYWETMPDKVGIKDTYDLIGQCICRIAPFFASDNFVDFQTFPDFAEATRNLNPGPFSGLKWNDKQLGIPLGQADLVLAYNKDLFDQANIPYPSPTKPMTYSEFLNIARTLTIVENGEVLQYGFHDTGRSEFMLQFFAEMSGGSMYDRIIDPTKVTLNNEAGIEALTKFKELSQYQPPQGVPADSVWTTGDFPALQTGKIGLTTLGPWVFNAMKEDEKVSGRRYGVAPIWVSDDGRHLARNGTNALGIPKTSKNQEAAWEFVKWAIQTPAQVSYASFSDVPVDRAAVAQLDHIIDPPEFYPTLMVEVSKFQPSPMSVQSDALVALYIQILNEMSEGKRTPAETAAELEKQGNEILAR